MTIDDLKDIFKDQFTKPDILLWFVIQDTDYKKIECHHCSDLDGLLLCLNGFHYGGRAGTMPMFVK